MLIDCVGTKCGPRIPGVEPCVLLCSCCTEEALTALQLVAEIACASAACPITAAPDPTAGAIMCTYTAAALGMYRLQLTSRGRHLAGSPFSVRVWPPTACPLLPSWGGPRLTASGRECRVYADTPYGDALQHIQTCTAEQSTDMLYFFLIYIFRVLSC